jgi:hypothetical protein
MSLIVFNEDSERVEEANGAEGRQGRADQRQNRYRAAQSQSFGLVAGVITDLLELVCLLFAGILSRLGRRRGCEGLLVLRHGEGGIDLWLPVRSIVTAGL